MIFLYYRKGSCQNHPKSLFLNAFINVELSFFTNWLQIFITGIFHSTGSNRAVILTGAKGSNRITLKNANFGHSRDLVREKQYAVNRREGSEDCMPNVNNVV